MKFIKLIVLISSLYTWGQQGNYNYNNFGNRSILLSGNVTGSVSDIGLTLYNPARLIELENTGFAFNAKAYQLDALEFTTTLDEERQISNTSFGGVPSMAGGTFTLFGERFAYSFVARRRSDINLRVSSNNITENILNVFPEAETYNLNASLGTRVKEDWYGLTWARKVTEQLNLGISIFAASYNYSGTRSLSHTIQYDEDAVGYYFTRTGFGQKSYGFHVKVGANYKLNEIDLGLNMNIPYLQVFGDADYSYNEVVSGIGSGFDVFYDYQFSDLNSKRKEPFGVSVGAGIPVKRSKIHLNIDYVSGLSSYQRIHIPEIDIGETTPTEIIFNEARKFVINFGIGGELYLSEKLKSYFGFSTDFNAFKSNATAFDLSTDDAENSAIAADFYHLSGGIDWKMAWANIILGVTYASGTSNFRNPFTVDLSGVDFENTQAARLSSQRYQFIVGLEIPILDKTLNKFQKKLE